MSYVKWNSAGLAHFTDASQSGHTTGSAGSDGDTATYVQTLSYWAFDLGAGITRKATKLRVHCLNGYAATSFINGGAGKFQGSNDSTNGSNGTWQDICALGDFITANGSGWFETTTMAGTNTSYRFFRLSGLPGNSNTVITEVEVFGDARVPHRYWRLYINSTSSTYVSASEIELRTAPGGADVTGSGTASDSTHYNTSSTGTQAFDNNTATIWASLAGMPQWVQYDFGAGNEKDIQQFTFRTTTYPAEGPQNFALQYSDDGSTWFNLYTVDSQPTWSSGETRVFTVPSEKPRYWRIKITANASGGYYTVTQAAEIELREAAGGADKTGVTGTYLESGHYTSGSTGDKAFDNDAATYWTSDIFPGDGSGVYIGWDFGAGNGYDIVEFAIKNRDVAPTAAPRDFTVESSFDGAAWTTKGIYRGQTFNASEQKVFTLSLQFHIYVADMFRILTLFPVPDGNRIPTPRLLATPVYGPANYLKGIFSGSGYVAGTVTHDGAVAVRNVYLFHRATGTLVQKTTSAADGTYRFNNVNPGEVFLVVATDADVDEFNAACADIITPAT